MIGKRTKRFGFGLRSGSTDVGDSGDDGGDSDDDDTELDPNVRLSGDSSDVSVLVDCPGLLGVVLIKGLASVFVALEGISFNAVESVVCGGNRLIQL